MQMAKVYKASERQPRQKSMLKKVFLITLSASLSIEGLWFFLGIKMGPDTSPPGFISLIALWVIALIGALLSQRLPLLTVITSVANLAGCIYVRNLPQGYRTPSNFIHEHLMDFIMVASSFALYIQTTSEQAQASKGTSP
jgi:hypothetical protein